jgi:endonuclease/exonuclease/phosphatase (EEP) superfamily protein YafD
VLLLFYYFDYKRFRDKIFISLLAGAFLYQVTVIMKYTPLMPVEVGAGSGKPGNNSFTILQSNVRMENRKDGEFRELVAKHDPDILCVNEPDAWWDQRLQEVQANYPHCIKIPLANTYGMMLFSKFPFRKKEVNFLIEKHVPSIFATVVLPSGTEVDIYCVHPEPPKPGSSTEERDIELLVIGDKIREGGRPSIVVGDLNDVGWSYTSQRFQNRARVLDPRVGRGIYNTYNVFVPLVRYPLDHFFHTEHFMLNGLTRLESFGSDHYPMLIDLEYTR